MSFWVRNGFFVAFFVAKVLRLTQPRDMTIMIRIVIAITIILIMIMIMIMIMIIIIIIINK